MFFKVSKLKNNPRNNEKRKTKCYEMCEIVKTNKIYYLMTLWYYFFHAKRSILWHQKLCTLLVDIHLKKTLSMCFFHNFPQCIECKYCNNHWLNIPSELINMTHLCCFRNATPLHVMCFYFVSCKKKKIGITKLSLDKLSHLIMKFNQLN